MSTTTQRRSSKERFWRRLVGQWRRSGLSIRDFRAEEQISEPSFYAWRRTIAQRDAESARFVPMHVIPDEKPAAAREASHSGLERKGDILSGKGTSWIHFQGFRIFLAGNSADGNNGLMPRTARASVGNVCYHVINRGNRRAEVFHQQGDYAAFVKLIWEGVVRIPMRVLGFPFKKTTIC